MVLPDLHEWTHDTADLRREAGKRLYSPSSFFFSQGKALVLAAEYFTDERLADDARGGVAYKHRHRIHLALFGQLMASLEYLLKDFIAQVIDLIPTFDDRVREAKWVTVDANRVLSSRAAPTTPGILLFHTTLGWYDGEEVNKRYSFLFRRAPIAAAEVHTLDRLWVLRHSVAHNAGVVLAHDAARCGLPELSGHVADINAEYIERAFDFLCVIARRIAVEVGDAVLLAWLATRVDQGLDYKRDQSLYRNLKYLATFVESRTQPLPKIGKRMYRSDFARAQNHKE